MGWQAAHELADEQWETVEPILLPSRREDNRGPSVTRHTSVAERCAVDSGQWCAVGRDAGHVSTVSDLPSPVQPIIRSARSPQKLYAIGGVEPMTSAFYSQSFSLIEPGQDARFAVAESSRHRLRSGYNCYRDPKAELPR